jgi:4-alpha-glucanotransferase
MLCDVGLITRDELEAARQKTAFYCEFERLNDERMLLLAKASKRMTNCAPIDEFMLSHPECESFCRFMALKKANGGKEWTEWTVDVPDEDELRMWRFAQFVFFTQWAEIKAYANKKGIKIIGDIPIYTAYDSVEAWAYPELFCFDKNKKPIDVAGCPPDEFSPTGQLWGNPVYDWKYHKKTNYKWWTDRISFAAEIYDVVRIDHFRGFESYYAIPFGNKTAEKGEWRKGPGAELFKLAEKKLGRLNIIAEDLGFITPEVRQMLDDVGYPGMKVLQFAFDNSKNEHLPHNFKNSNCFAYTGTHDNETLIGWVDNMPPKNLKFARKYLNVKKLCKIPYAVIKCTWASIAQTAVAQIQDFIESEADGRMNTPSTLGKNWQFRTVNSDFSPALSLEIKRLNKLYNRLGE